MHKKGGKGSERRMGRPLLSVETPSSSLNYAVNFFPSYDFSSSALPRHRNLCMEVALTMKQRNREREREIGVFARVNRECIGWRQVSTVEGGRWRKKSVVLFL